MKKLICALLLVAVVLTMAACGKSEAAAAADNLIIAIGTVTLNSGDKIVAAENAVAALSESDLGQLENMAALVAARESYDALVAAKEAEEEAARVAALQAAAADMDAMINAIGEVTAESEAAIAAARAAYNALDAETQGYVTALAALEAAESALSDLRVQSVEEIINAIGKVTLESGEAIDAAQAAYDALSNAEAAKVTNADVLAAAKTQLKDLKAAEAQTLLKKLVVEEDYVRGINFYYPKAFPRGSEYWYADVRCFVLPYMGISGNDVWLRLVCNYTEDDWVFFEKITFAVDDARYYKYFSYWDVTRDNDSGDVWEYVDLEVGASEIELLYAIANSTKTVIRFEGDDYYYDFTVKQSDKEAILQILTIYELLLEQ